MSEEVKIRYSLLKFMYIYTILTTGIAGFCILIAPDLYVSLLGMPTQDPIILGFIGSILVGFAISSILGLRSPLKFLPVLMLQLTYKVVWYIGVILPLVITGTLEFYGIFMIAFFAVYVVGDLIAIPFPYLFKKAK